MPLERARDSINNLQRLAGNRNLSDLILEDGEEDEQEEEDGRSSYLGLEVEGSGGRFGGIPRTRSGRSYWEGGSDWQDYATVVPIPDSNGSGTKNICFALFPFCDPYADENDDTDDDDNDAQVTNGMYGDVNVSTSSSTSERPGGIVRRGSNYYPLTLGINNKQRKSFRPATYRPRPDGELMCKRHVRFAPTKTEVRICPLDRISKEERAAYWWSMDEFDGIKKATVLLIQPEEMTGLCKTWLAKCPRDALPPAPASPAPPPGGGPASPANKKDEEGWWHKYGDSRRGLERYASPDEAPQILDSYDMAVYQVLAEQQRQRRWNWWRCCSSSGSSRADAADTDGPERIARVYKEFTAWSRDLALASGASDADAVACDFDDGRRKSREYFLLKQLSSNQMRIHKRAPDFMVPPGLQPTGYLKYSMVEH
mmetsp:Transcript_20957/g.45709  ORF Transcript_20957/g.45709 Transcript_20957/m.45709 type:complete len:426 (-) Transcript_20957:106-1383(-)